MTLNNQNLSHIYKHVYRSTLDVMLLIVFVCVLVHIIKCSKFLYRLLLLQSICNNRRLSLALLAHKTYLIVVLHGCSMVCIVKISRVMKIV